MSLSFDDRTTHLRMALVARRSVRGGKSGYEDAVAGIEFAGAGAIERFSATQTRQLCRAEESLARLKSRAFLYDPGELLIGRMIAGYLPLQAEMAHAKEILQAFGGAGGQNGHCELDLEPIFRLGVQGLVDDLHARSAATSGDEADTLRSFAIALSGVTVLLHSAASAARAALLAVKAAQDPVLYAEIEEVAARCERLQSTPPESFCDAVQLYWIVWLAVTFGSCVGCVSLGHPDRWGYPYYQRDLAQGRMTKERALELMECLYLHLNEIGADGVAYPVMVGGLAPNGVDCANELSMICMEALRKTNLVYPTVGICWNTQTPSELVNLAVELVAAGYTTPAFFGDEVIQTGMKHYGVPADEAWQYINSTCVEITPVAASNVWVASPYFPLCSYLLQEIKEHATGEKKSDSFEAFLEKYFCTVEGEIAKAVAMQDQQRRNRAQNGRKPLQSVFTRDCIGRARDIDDGGARYNWVECSFVGLANLADSLHVLREEVFTKQHLTLSNMHSILDSNFEGHEDEQKKFLDAYPKYGQGCVEVDALVGTVMNRLSACCANHKVYPDNAHFVPGAFCWIMHERLGSTCGATPDGRRAGFPFADGCGPAQGRECKGPTAAILSTTSWEHAAMLGGLAMNMKFSRALFAGGDAEQGLRNLILTFLRRGGFELQMNVVDNDLLIKAKENPDAYRDLVVRIGGYTDYFTRLSPQMQEEVLLRYEFSAV